MADERDGTEGGGHDRPAVGPDETVRWTVTEEGDLAAEVVPQRYGAVSELEPVDIGEETNAAEDHDRVAYGN